MTTSIITSTVTRKDAMLRLLANLAAQSITPDEIILVEAGEAIWDVSEIPPSLRNRFSVFYAKGESLAASRNRGRKAAQGDILFFLDDDIIIPNTYIEDALHFFSDNPSVMAIGGIYTDPSIVSRAGWSLMLGRLLGIYADGSSNRILPSGWADYVRGTAAALPSSAQWLFGCNAAVRSIAFSDSRVRFETKMIAWSFLEDVFLGASLTTAYGDCLRILPQLAVIHAPPTSGGRISKMTVRMRILYRYMFWRDYVANGNWGRSGRFWLGMAANLLLMFKQERKIWVVGTCLQTHLFQLRHKDMTWETANEFIISRD